MPTLTVEQVRTFSTTLFRLAGASDEDARIVTDSLLWASLHGHDTHGAGQLPTYVRMYLGRSILGDVNKNASPTIISETPATVALDGNWCLGQKVATRATDLVIEKASTTGIAAATFHRNTHTGALGYYTERIARNDMIGLMFTGAEAVSPPYGGVQRLLGTNPISFSIPAQDEHPIIVDMATSATTWGGLRLFQLAGQPLPEGLFLDDKGEPTTDPTKFSGPARGGPVHGAMANMSNSPKGYGIQLAVEMLGSLLPALVTGNEVVQEGRLHTAGFIIAVNISFFQDVTAFKRKVDERIREIRASKRKPGVEAIYLPGERGFRTQEQRLREGIPILDAYWEEITNLAEEMDVDLRALLGAPAAG